MVKIVLKFLLVLIVLFVIYSTAFTAMLFKKTPSVDVKRYTYDGVHRDADVPGSRRWMENAMEVIRFERTLDLPTVARYYAYVASVYNDVLDATKDAQQASLASARIISMLYPQQKKHVTSLLQSSNTQVITLTPTSQSIVDRYIARSQTDGFSLLWNGQVPQNGWYRRHYAIEAPRAGEWKPWIVTDTATLYASAPVASGSAAYLYQVERTRFARSHLADEDIKNSYFWNNGAEFSRSPNGTNGTAAGIWQNVLFRELGSVSDMHYALLQKELAQTIADASIVCWGQKYRFWYPRPSVSIEKVRPLITDPESPSYPSGTSCVNGAAATFLGASIPQKLPVFRSIVQNANDARLKGATNWEMDTVAGTALGSHVGNRVLQSLGKSSDTHLPTSTLMQSMTYNQLTSVVNLGVLRLVTWYKSMRRPTNSMTLTQTEQTLKRAINDHPTEAEPYIALADFYRSQQKLSQSVEEFRQAIALDPTNDAPYVYLANYLRHIPPQYDEAESLLLKALELNPYRDLTYEQLGKLYLDEKKYALAEKFLTNAIDLRPVNYGKDGAYMPLVALYKSQNRYALAQATLEKILAVDPTPELYIELAKLYREQNNHADVDAVFAKALQLFPQSTLLIKRREHFFDEKEELSDTINSEEIVK